MHVESYPLTPRAQERCPKERFRVAKVTGAAFSATAAGNQLEAVLHHELPSAPGSGNSAGSDPVYDVIRLVLRYEHHLIACRGQRLAFLVKIRVLRARWAGVTSTRRSPDDERLDSASVSKGLSRIMRWAEHSWVRHSVTALNMPLVEELLTLNLP